MPFDLNILCCNQTISSPDISFQSVFTFDLFTDIPNGTNKPYGYHWSFMSQSPGFWYYLLPVERTEDTCSCYEMCEIYYPDREPELELGDEMLTGAEWREYKESLPFLEIKREFRADFEKVIDFFLDESPSKTILFLARYQGQEEDIVDGVYPVPIFFEMLDDYRVKFNTCYIIRKESEEYQKRWVQE